MPQANQVAIVTGGGTGVGRETSLLLAKRGYHVAINYSRSRDEAEQTAADIRKLGVESLAIQADVSDDAAARMLVAKTVAAWDRVDVLVNSAGTTQFIPFENLDQVSDDIWDRLFRVNVVGAFHCARAVREPMLKCGGGVIVNVSSVAGTIGQGSSIPYCCTKAALDNLTISLARTLAPTIRVNGVAPGFIAGRWLQGGLGPKYEKVKQAYDRTLPLGRVCEPLDVADCILSLITGSKLVTGQTLTVDSGMTIAGFHVRLNE